MPSERIRVLIAEDSPVALRAIEELLGEFEDEFCLVGVAGDADRAVEVARRTTPDVALLDVRMPGGGGPVATVGIRGVSPRTQVLAYSAADDRESVMAMLRSGARGYLLKGSKANDLLAGLRSCAAGGTTISDGLSQHLLAEMTDQAERAIADELQLKLDADRILELLGPDGVTPVFQPIMDLRSEQIAGYEGLARFADGRSPEDVFRDAHEIGLGMRLELHAARLQVAHFRAASSLTQGCYLAINASAALLGTAEMVELARPGPGERRVIEITEHSDENAGLLAEAVSSAQRRNVAVAIDDAGAGFSGLKRIVEVSPDILKVDRSLVTGIDQERPKRAIVASLASYCREMELSIVAEGIETEAELDVLRSLGVTHGQGYLLGRPGPFSV